MKNKIFALVAACVLVLNAFADIKPKKVTDKQTDPLVALLPASDGVAVLDAGRFFADALPQLLAANQPLLNEIFGKLGDIKNKTGIDLRKFDRVAVGLAGRRVTAKKIEFEPVVIARGEYNAAALVAIAKIASDGKYREEKIGDKTLYIFSFSAKDIVEKNKPAAASKVSGAVDKIGKNFMSEIAVTSLSSDTLAFGSVARVRQTLAANTHVDAQLVNLLQRKENAVMSFAFKAPTGLSKYISLDNDELGKNLDAIRFLYGSADVAGGNTALQLTARTISAERAQSLLETLEGLQHVGKAFLGGAKSADKQVFARMIDNVKFSRNANEINLDLAVPQSDIDILVGKINLTK